MAGGDQLNSVDYPPLPTFHQNQTNKHQNSSPLLQIQKNVPPPSQISSSANLAHGNQELVVGSIPITPISYPLEPSLSIPQKTNRLDTLLSNPPPISLISPEIVHQEGVLNASSSPLLLEGDLIAKAIDAQDPKKAECSNLAKAFSGDFNVHPCHQILGDGIIVDRFSQLVTYGVIPDYCDNCLHMGHCNFDCKVMANKDKDVRAVSHRLKVVEDRELSIVVPIVSVFNRLHEDMTKKDSLGDKTLLEQDLVLVEYISEEEAVSGGCSKGDMSIPKSNNPIIDNSVNQSLGPSTMVPGAVHHSVIDGATCLLSKVEVQADMDVEIIGEKLDLVGDKSGAEEPISQSAELNSSTVISLQPPLSFTCSVDQGNLIGDTSLVSKLCNRAAGLGEAVGKELLFRPGTSADDPQSSGLQLSFSDRPASPSLRLHISDPGTAVQGLLVVSDSIISKDEVRDANHQPKAGEELHSAAETPVNEPLAAGLSKTISDSSVASSLKSPSSNPGTPSLGSLEGTARDVIKWLSKKVGLSIQDNLQHKKLQQEENVDATVSNLDNSNKIMALPDTLKASKSSQKIVIKDPVTREIVHLSPKANSLSTPANITPAGPNKNTKKKGKKNKKQKKRDSKSEVDSQVHKSSSSQVSSDSSLEGHGDLNLQQLQKACEYAADEQVTPSTQIHPATIKEVEQITPLNASINKGISSPPSTQLSWAQEVEAAEALDLLPLLEAYHKGHFNVAPSESKTLTWAEEVESTPLSLDELAGALVGLSQKEVLKTSKKYTTKEAAPRKAALSSSLGVKVTVKTKVKEGEDSIEKATDDKVPKELFFFPPRPSTPAGVPSTYASKKFNKEFLKPP